MQIELLVIDNCPHAADAATLLRASLDDIGLPDLAFTTTVVASDEDAHRLRFVGSPTFTADGQDLFPQSARGFSLSCRLYPPQAGVPDLRDLRKALKQAAALSADP